MSLFRAILKVASKDRKVRRMLINEIKKTAMEFESEEALKKYLKEHPGADPKNHSVKKTKKKRKAKLTPDEKRRLGVLKERFSEGIQGFIKNSLPESYPFNSPTRNVEVRTEWSNKLVNHIEYLDENYGYKNSNMREHIDPYIEELKSILTDYKRTGDASKLQKFAK